MKLLARYTVAEFMSVFLLALLGMTSFFLLVGIGREAIQEGLGPEPIMRLLPYVVPDSMRFSIPASALLAVCVVFGRMSNENEIVAIKSLGMSPWGLMAPVFVMGFLISVFAVWVNDVSVTWGRTGMSRVVSHSIEQIAYGMLNTQRSFSSDRFSITVRDVQGKRLILPTLTFHGDRDKGEGDITVSAREAVLRLNPREETLSVFLTDGTIEGPDQIEGAFSGTHERVIELNSLEQSRDSSPSDYPLGLIPAERTTQQQQIRRLEYGLATMAAFQMVAGDFSALGAPVWDEYVIDLRRERYRMNRLWTEPWRRWANGFSCFFFVLIGAPWAINRRHADFVTIFFSCFLPILLVYYPLMAYGVDRAKEGALPQYAVWLGNAVCGLIAIRLIQRVLKY